MTYLRWGVPDPPLTTEEKKVHKSYITCYKIREKENFNLYNVAINNFICIYNRKI